MLSPVLKSRGLGRVSHYGISKCLLDGVTRLFVR